MSRCRCLAGSLQQRALLTAAAQCQLLAAKTATVSGLSCCVLLVVVPLCLMQASRRSLLLAIHYPISLMLLAGDLQKQAAMAPKTAEKKVAGKAVAQKKGGKKGGKKRSVESWKIYIYKVCSALLALPIASMSVSAWDARCCCCCCCCFHAHSVLLHCGCVKSSCRR